MNWAGCAIGASRHPAVDAALAAVQELGCARVQGFLLSPPVVADAVDGLRAERPWRPLLATNGAG